MSRTHVFFLQLDTECGVGNDTADALCLLLYTTCIAVWHAALRPYIYISLECLRLLLQIDGLVQPSPLRRVSDRPHRQIDKMFFMCFAICPRTLASIVTRLQPISVVLNVRGVPLKFIYEARLKEERPFSSAGATEQTHNPRLPR